MKTRNIPRSYFINLRGEIGWDQILSKLGIKFKRTHRGIGIYVAKCIFHKEKTPSLVFTNQGTYYCFGCGDGGDMFMFISYALTGHRFGNAQKTCRWLKKCFGIPLPWSR
ncbi:MAG: CHC2 zinc finger domain-containing protein [Candidatus Moranbacteria bacterium]|jgi:DNA primase|nr:CHC2 zinc finger domain-containing protein [Candidatus Moranbacteria bacterium]